MIIKLDNQYHIQDDIMYQIYDLIHSACFDPLEDVCSTSKGHIAATGFHFSGFLKFSDPNRVCVTCKTSTPDVILNKFIFIIKST